MAHKEQKDFCLKVRSLFPERFRDTTVLDVGSLDVNGNNRYLFRNCSYLGLDIVDGPNVRIVTPVHLFDLRVAFNVVISIEMLEHDRHWMESLNRMYELTKAGGLLLLTCAAPGRPEHGTVKRNPGSSPGTNDYYKNISVEMFESILSQQLFQPGLYHLEQVGHDLQFWGIKK